MLQTWNTFVQKNHAISIPSGLYYLCLSEFTMIIYTMASCVFHDLQKTCKKSCKSSADEPSLLNYKMPVIVSILSQQHSPCFESNKMVVYSFNINLYLYCTNRDSMEFYVCWSIREHKVRNKFI